MEEWLTILKAAPLLHVHPETLRTWCREGKIEARFVGNQYLIQPSTIDNYLKNAPLAAKARPRKPPPGTETPDSPKRSGATAKTAARKKKR